MGLLPALEETAQPGAGIVSAEAEARVGMRVGDFQIESVLGEGGTCVVYRGRHVASDRPVAIKILHDRGARQNDVVEQFIGEARATSRIRHPNVVDVIDLGTTPDGTVFLVMEYLKGESLQSRLHSVARLPLFEAINILRQVARGLGAAHLVGIVHGGLKPADIFLCKRKGRRRIVRRSKAQGMRMVVEPEVSFDLVKLLDFGMARFLDLAPGAQARAGAVHGTLHYLSPEQAQEQPADQQSDIYSLGAVFYEMITGAVPFAGESLLDILRGHVSGQVIAPSRRTPRAGIDGRIDGLIMKCLKKNPNLRFASTGELCDALDACTSDCAFLRDAHRLPGIRESGIDLSEAMLEARQDPARAAEKPVVAKEKVAVESVKKNSALAPVAKPIVLTETSAEVAGQPHMKIEVRTEAIVPDLDDRPARFNLKEDARARSRRPRVIALAGVLLLGGVGISVWGTHGGSAKNTAKPVVAAQPVASPAPSPAPSPPRQATAPVAAPVAPAAPAPMAALPRPERAAPAAVAISPGKVAPAPARAHSARTSSARRTTSKILVQPESVQVPVAETVPTPAAPSESASESASTTEPTPTLSAPATVDALVREAQRAWMAGNYAAAIGKAQSALKAEPKPAQAVQAYEIIATSSCAIGQADAAREAFSHLGDTKRELVKATCAKHGVTID